MPSPSCCDRLTIRVVLLKVSPLVARLISVPDDLSLEELHDVLQLVLGWSGQAFYNFVSTAKRSAAAAICEPTSCASSSFGAAKSSYIPTTSSICGNGRFAFWISNREGQKPGGPVAWQAGPRRHRKNAAVRAGTCEFWISTSTIRPWQNRSWSRRPCSA